MTLQELSPQYARQAETVARRLRELRQQELAEGDPQAAQTLARGSRSCGPCCGRPGSWRSTPPTITTGGT